MTGISSDNAEQFPGRKTRPLHPEQSSHERNALRKSRGCAQIHVRGPTAAMGTLQEGAEDS